MFHRRTLVFIVILCVLVVILGYNYIFRPFESAVISDQLVTPSSIVTDASEFVLSPEAAVAEILAMPITVPTEVTSATPSAAYVADMAWVDSRHPGLITLFGKNISTASARTTIAALDQFYVTQPPPIMAVDHEGGTVQRLNGSGFTRLPSWQSLCSQSATSSAQLLATSAQELKQVGVDMVLAPMVDVGTTQSALKTRICSNDPAVIVAKASQFIQSFEQQSILTTLKHFPGIGATTRDLHFAFEAVTVTANDATVYQQLLVKFPQLAVLVSHAGVTNQFPDKPCSLSPECVGELKQNYSQVLVVSDALEMISAGHQVAPPIPIALGSGQALDLTIPERAVAAVKAGNEVLLFGESVDSAQMEAVFQTLLSEYQRDPTFQMLINQAAGKVRLHKQSP